jgi:hypothetical protein
MFAFGSKSSPKSGLDHKRIAEIMGSEIVGEVGSVAEATDLYFKRKSELSKKAKENENARLPKDCDDPGPFGFDG